MFWLKAVPRETLPPKTSTLYHPQVNFRRGALLTLALLSLPLLSSCIRVLNPIGWAPAAFDGDTVYVTTSKGHLSALKLQGDTAAASWTFPDKDRSEDKKLKPQAIYGAPVIESDRIYFATFHAGIFALNKSDGRPTWPGPESNASRIDGDVPGGVAIAGDTLFFGTSEGRLYGWKKSDGTPAAGWQEPKSLEGGIWATPVVIGDTVYVSTMKGRLHAYAVDDGTEKWPAFRATGAIAELARINDDLLFVPSINHHAYVIRTSNGSIAGDFPASDWIWTTPAVDQGKIYFGDFSGKVYALDITSGAKELWTPASVNGERVKAGTAIINGVLVVADRKPVVTFINAQDGSIVNRVPLPPGSGTVRAAVTAHENAAYIVTDKGQLFRAESPKVTPIQLSGVKK
jgi:outer membrane protein assembly factor BamB